ncbi:MAG: PQQ-binding-like beta-propeller repeat protein [Planctomycetaceae bacterium]
MKHHSRRPANLSRTRSKRCIASTISGALIFGTLLLGALAPFAQAGDWPQILGPQRNGKAPKEEKLAESWPVFGPPVLWTKNVGDGYAGIVTAGDRAILFHRLGDNEVIECLQVDNGKTLWTSEYPTTFRAQVGGGTGPLATPAIADGKVVTFGAQGVLACHDLKTGERQWLIKTHEDYGAREGYFGAGSSPLVDEGRVIVNVGGFRSNASVVAFSLKTGEELWKTLNDHASYSSPVITHWNDKKQIAIITRLHCLLLNPKTGAIDAQFDFGQVGPTVNGAVPTVLGNQLFLTASYGIGGLLLTNDTKTTTETWRADDLYSSQYCTPIEHQGVLFGVDGRDDLPPAELKCFDPITRKTLWTAPESRYGHLIFADGKLLMLSTDGQLSLIRANILKYDPIATCSPLTGTTRAIPALSNGRLFIRDDKILKCLNVAPKP